MRKLYLDLRSATIRKQLEEIKASGANIEYISIEVDRDYAQQLIREGYSNREIVELLLNV